MSDIILISKVGLYETVKCAICKNPNQTERGCDGSCQYDKELHEKIVEAVEGIAEQRPRGEWVYKNGKYWCSSCGEKAIYHSHIQAALPHLTNFCPNCGSDNRKKEDKPHGS